MDENEATRRSSAATSGGEIQRRNERRLTPRPSREGDLTVDQLTAEQVAEFKEAFALFDKDGDGTITYQELAHVMRGLGQNPTEEEVKNMIDEVDSDGNGSIEFAEFLLLISNKLRTEDIQDEMNDAFKVFDKNGDGVLTPTELREMLEKFGEKMKQEDIDEFIRTADKDGDGRIDYEEFVNILMQ